MIVGICADPHGLVGRMHAFATEARGRGAQELWCLGDVVDSLIGAPPAALAEAVSEALKLHDVVLAGNHELWCVQRGLFDEETAAAVSTWSPVERRHGVGLVHASLDDPFMEFVDAPDKAGRLLHAATPDTDWLAVHGHTHRRRLWAWTDEAPHAESRPTKGVVTAADGDRLLACPGALTGGRPSWLLADLEQRTLQWFPLRVPRLTAPPLIQ